MLFTKTTDLTPFIQALQRDYEAPEGCSIWTGYAPQGETAVAFLDSEGLGLILLSRNPASYVICSAAMARGAMTAADYAHMDASCPEEWEMDGGDAVDVSGGTFSLRAA